MPAAEPAPRPKTPPKKKAKRASFEAEKTTRVQVMLRRMGAKIHAARERREFSQADLAVRAGCSISYISMLERGQREPTLAAVIEITKALRIDPASLYDWSTL